MTNFIEVHTTTDSKETAQKIAEAVVTKRFAACAQVSGPMFTLAVNPFWLNRVKPGDLRWQH